jgi:hypothetical protein
MKTYSRCLLPITVRLATVGLGLFYIQATQAGAWITNGPLITARADHTATLLTNGLVLIVGGDASGSSELYNPATGTNAATGTMKVARLWHTATLLQNGQVLVVGGVDDHSTEVTNYWLASAELYNPATGTWTLTGSLHTPRVGHSSTLLPDGRVLVAGGTYLIGGALNSAELYDPASGLWMVTGSLTNQRCNHTATLLPNGKVLAAGGSQGTLPPPYGELSSAELYDPVSGNWSLTGSLQFARQNHAAVLLPDGTVLVAGGGGSYAAISSAERFDPTNGFWTAANSLKIARDAHTATWLPDGKALITGGRGTNHNDLASTELYDPTNGVWTTSAAMKLARRSHAAALLPDGKLLVTGGYAGGKATNSVEVFDYLAAPAPTVTTLTGARKLSDGAFQFGFTNNPGASFAVLAATNPASPQSNWTSLGGALEVSAGQFQFTDSEATNCPRRFYRLGSP